MFGAFADIGRGLVHWRTWWALGFQDIDIRYKRSVLGPFWITSSLVALVLTLAFLYSEIFQTEYVEYVSFLACGQLTWVLLVALVQEGSDSVMESSSMMRSIPLPISVSAGRVVMRNIIIFFHNLIAIMVVLLMFGRTFEPVVLMVFPGLAVLLFFGYCCCLILGPLSARFRDIPQLIVSFMQVAFFMTPIIWMPSVVSHRPMFIESNPLYHFVELIRAPLLGAWPTALNWTVSGIMCLIAAIAAVVTLAMTHRRVALWL